MAFYGLRFIPFVPRRASLIRPEKVRGLSERSEFPRAPDVSTDRCSGASCCQAKRQAARGAQGIAGH
jgi:hypothetical protein